MTNEKNLMPKINKNIIIGISIAVVLIFLVIVIWVLFQKGIAPLEEETVISEEQAVPEEMKVGEEGEIEEGKTLEEVNPEAVIKPVRPPGTLMPPVVFNTQGTITSVQKDGIMVQGNGSNFEDQKPRTLNIKFTDQTITTEQQGRVRHLGLEGLKYLSPGDNILVESQENIRGKTEFQASYINKI